MFNIHISWKELLLLVKLIFKFVIFVIIELPVWIISYIIAPIIVLFQKDGQLPKSLKWFQPYDNDLYGGRDWKVMHPPPENQTWWIMTRYLWRNSIGTFSYTITGLLPDTSIFYVQGDKSVQNRPYPGKSGVLFVMTRNSFMFYWVRQWKNSDKCIRLLVGWKLMTLAQTGTAVQTELVLTFNPIMGFALIPG